MFRCLVSWRMAIERNLQFSSQPLMSDLNFFKIFKHISSFVDELTIFLYRVARKSGMEVISFQPVT